MASLKRLRAIRRLEYLIFGGVPEAPEPMFDRDGNPQAEGRITGRAVWGGQHHAVDIANSRGRIEFDPRTGDVRVIRREVGEEDSP